MNNMWENMWGRQELQQAFFGLNPKIMSALEKAETAKILALGLYEEAAELARVVTHYKAHVLHVGEIDKNNVADEAADVLKYLISIAQLCGIGPREMHEAFNRKTNVVHDRAVGERLELSSNTDVVLVDLDGCIADLSELDRLLEGQRTSVKEALKDEFRRAGGFRELPLIDGARMGMKQLHNWGYKIVIITARPHRQHKRLHADTIEWLRINQINYDLILFKRDKAEAICDYIHPAQPICFIEDKAKHALEIVDTEVPVYLLNGHTNTTLGVHPLITRVPNWTEIRQSGMGDESLDKNSQSID
jgi:NTP pyrophosphatase (non-canonical NTP hydrolase)